MRVFDVIVVGAGPAGATAAKTLGEAGVSTLVLDKASFPRDKPCGGGISARAISRFPYLKDALQKIPTNWVSKVYFESPDGSAVDYESDQPLYAMIRRCQFDDLLLSLARAHVEYRPGALIRKISIERERAVVSAEVAGEMKEYACRVVIGCDGANSVVARAAGLRAGKVQSDYAIDMMEETPYAELKVHERDRMYVYYRLQAQYGYGYVFPKTEFLNLGVGFKLDYYLSQLRGKHYSYHQAFTEELKSKGLVEGTSNERNFRAFPLPISGPLKRTYTDRLLVAGDAGAFVNAFTAEGIYYAMVSGEHAGRTAAQAVRRGQFDGQALRAYEASWKREIGAELSKSVDIQRLLMTDAGRVDRIVSAAARSPKLAEILAMYATGAISYGELKRGLIARALPLYLKEKARALLPV
ncbi:MAG TPA: geranylgeranyl reductase family protein [Bryobacteraceae bacterium]|nr:geranylgeranyl reductase family protein [Bryobacteraceae bacterium]